MTRVSEPSAILFAAAVEEVMPLPFQVPSATPPTGTFRPEMMRALIASRVAAGVAPSDALVQALSQVQVQLSLPVLPLPTVSPSSAKVVANGASADLAGGSGPASESSGAGLAASYGVSPANGSSATTEN